jgi:hypothetical protein
MSKFKQEKFEENDVIFKALEMLMQTAYSASKTGHSEKECIAANWSVLKPVVEKAMKKCRKKRGLLANQMGWPGDIAKKHRIVVGSIGCPHCGAVANGTLTPVCEMCDKPYWEKI